MPKKKRFTTGYAHRKYKAEKMRLKREYETEEETAKRRAGNAESTRRQRQRKGKPAARSVSDAERQRLRRQRESEEEAAARRKACAERQKLRRQMESEEEAAARRKADAERQKLRRQRESEEAAAARRKACAERQKLRRQMQREEAAAVRRKVDAARQKLRRQLESEEEAAARRRAGAERQRLRRQRQKEEAAAMRITAFEAEAEKDEKDTEWTRSEVEEPNCELEAKFSPCFKSVMFHSSSTDSTSDDFHSGMQNSSLTAEETAARRYYLFLAGSETQTLSSQNQDKEVDEEKEKNAETKGTEDKEHNRKQSAPRRRVRVCDANGCTNTTQNSDKPFFIFPYDAKRKSQWMKALKVTSKRSIKFACSDHFGMHSFVDTFRRRLHRTAIPESLPEKSSVESPIVECLSFKVESDVKEPCDLEPEKSSDDTPRGNASITSTEDEGVVIKTEPVSDYPDPENTSTYDNTATKNASTTTAVKEAVFVKEESETEVFERKTASSNDNCSGSSSFC